MQKCQRPIPDADPFISKHTNVGEAITTKLYIDNDGKRKGVLSDVVGEITLIYTNLKVQLSKSIKLAIVSDEEMQS